MPVVSPPSTVASALLIFWVEGDRLREIGIEIGGLLLRQSLSCNDYNFESGMYTKGKTYPDGHTFEGLFHVYCFLGTAFEVWDLAFRLAVRHGAL